jgi:tetratricopeptide (TPR) repeat protein
MFKPGFFRLVVVSLALSSPLISQVPRNGPTGADAPQNAKVYFDKANALRKEGKLKEAIEAFKAALLINPKSAEYYNELSYTYGLLGQDAEAADAARKALDIEPNNSYAAAHLGHLYAKMKQYDEAIKIFQKAIELAPQKGRNYVDLGYVYLETGKYEDAIKVSQQAIRYKAPEIFIAYNNIGYAYQMMGQYEASVAALKQSIEIDPLYLRAYDNLGRTLFLLGRYEDAAEVLKKAIGMKPDEFSPHRNLGDVYMKLHRYTQAAEELEHATRIDPKYAKVYHDLGLAYNEIGKFEGAIEAFTHVLSLKPQEANAILSRSHANLFLGRGLAAAADARKYLDLSGGRNEEDQYVYLVAHFGYRLAGLEPEAARVLDEAATKTASRSWPYPVIGYLRREITLPELLALATDGDKKTEAQAYVGTDLLVSGKNEEARPYLQWVKDNGNKSFVEYILAVAELQRLDKEAAPK